MLFRSVIGQLPPPVVPDVRAAVNAAFLDGMQIGSLVSAGIAAAAAAIVAFMLPATAKQPEPVAAEQVESEAVCA